MNAGENIYAQFQALLLQGSLAHSRCSRGFVKELRTLLDSGVIGDERSGAGRRFTVRDAAAAKSFIRQRYPDAAIFEGASHRVVAVGRFRDTKTLPFNEATLVSVRAWQSRVLIQGGQEVDAAGATAAHGVFSFLLVEGSPYSLRGTCALVENPAVFFGFERLNLPVGLALYGHGRAATRLLEWIARQPAPDFTLLHLPDYDPSGLGEFVRLRALLGPRVRLHQPADLAARFARFSNRHLLEKPNSRSLLANLRRSPEPEIREVLALIDRENAGLEQEALLL